MTIAVVIPVLNEARCIGQTLSHTATLGFDDRIVVDGAFHLNNERKRKELEGS